MNMTIKELIEKLTSKDAFQTYEGDDTKYIAAEFVLFVDGYQVKGIIENDEDETVTFELEDGTAEDYELDYLASVYFYRLEEL